MFKSNQQRLKSYTVERRMEEVNADHHQSRLYDQIAADLGEEVQASNYAKLAKRVVGKVNSMVQEKLDPVITKNGVEQKTGLHLLTDAIAAGKLSKIFDMVKKMDLTGLSKKAKIIVADIKNPNSRKLITEIFNERMTPILERQHATGQVMGDMIKEIEKEFIDVVAGGDRSVVEEVLDEIINGATNIAISRDSGEDHKKAAVSPVAKTAKKKQAKRRTQAQINADKKSAEETRIANLEKELASRKEALLNFF